MSGRPKIPITKPFLPPKEEYDELLNDIWERNWLTNNGPLVQDLEEKLKSYLDIPNLSLVSNGTIALQIAIKALGLKGEVITTPFSYVATVSSIIWEACTPVFVDIDPNTFNMDPNKIEDAITSKTSGIIATHVYGNPCDIESIKTIAEQYGTKVIYDAAHCFGTDYKDQSVFNYGDISATSFHATKLFHTVEGGAIIADDPETIKRVNLMRNFGHDGPNNFTGIGINGKNSELHAAMGLVNLRYIDKILQKRKFLSRVYDHHIKSLPVQKNSIQPNSKYNYSYFPVLFENEEKVEKVQKKLFDNDIQTRRYFYPLLSSLDYVEAVKHTPVAEDISKRILCLPLYHTLQENAIENIIKLIKSAIK